MCLYDLPTMPGHAPDEAADVLLLDLLPDLDESISQLLDSLWCNVALVDRMRQDVPDVLDWIKVWGTGRPVHSVDVFFMQELLTHFNHMRPNYCHASEGTQGPLHQHMVSQWV